MNIKVKLFSTLLVALFLSTFTVAQDCQMLRNGDFANGKSDWNLYKMMGGYGRINIVDDVMEVNIERKGKKPWAVQVMQNRLIFELGKTYKVSLDTKSDTSRPISIKIGQNGGDYKSYNFLKTDIDTSWKTISIEFTMNDSTDLDGRIELNIGDYISKVSFRNIKFEAVNCLNGTETKLVHEVVEKETTSGTAPMKDPLMKIKEGFSDIKITGYVRFNTVYRNMYDQWLAQPYAPKTFIFQGVHADDPPGGGFQSGYREPLLMLEVKSKPTPNTEIGVDFLIDNQLIGDLQDTTNKRIQSYRFLNFKGSAQTAFGKVNAYFGGVHFVQMSPFTLWSYQFRDDMFYRYPWEWETKAFKRYEQFFGDQAIARDPRFANSAIQGVMVDITDMPMGVGAKAMYGKTNNANNGFLSFLDDNFKYIFVTQLSKTAGAHKFAANFYQQKGYITNGYSKDNPSNIERENIISGTASLNFARKVSINSEFGAGTFVSPTVQTNTWTPAMYVKAVFDQKLTKVPLTLQVFHIGENVLNINNSVVNNIDGGNQFGQLAQYNTNAFIGALQELGMMVNNRQGYSLAVNQTIGNFNGAIGLGASQELVNQFNQVIFQHRQNALERSKFVFYRNQLGPYNRVLNNWRRSWETIQITDTGTVGYKKAFSTLDASLKYKTRIAGRKTILSYYMNYNSIQDGLAVVPKFDNSAFIRLTYQELMAFWNMYDDFTLIGQLSHERVLGNDRTEQATNGKYLDQTGYAIGVGFDWAYKDRAGLYFRQKWFWHEDANFVLDTFHGFETTVELKIFFE